MCKGLVCKKTRGFHPCKGLVCRKTRGLHTCRRLVREKTGGLHTCRGLICEKTRAMHTPTTTFVELTNMTQAYVFGYFTQADTEPVEGVAVYATSAFDYGRNRPRSANSYLCLRTFMQALLNDSTPPSRTHPYHPACRQFHCRLIQPAAARASRPHRRHWP